MIINMLKAVNKMLEGSTEPKVECAREIISELVEGLEKEQGAVFVPSGMDVGPGSIYPLDSSLDPDAQKAQKELMSDGD